LYNSTQSPGVPPSDSTSLILTGLPQSFELPLVTLVVVVKAPLPLGQRP
jgi:hypothetical protein